MLSRGWSDDIPGHLYVFGAEGGRLTKVAKKLRFWIYSAVGC